MLYTSLLKPSQTLIKSQISINIIFHIQSLFIDFPWQNFFEAGNISEYPLWVYGTIVIF